MKSLLRNEQEYQSLRESYENLPEIVGYTRSQPHTAWYLSKPDSYPCVCLFSHINNDNGADYYEGDYVYLEDFEDLATTLDQFGLGN